LESLVKTKKGGEGEKASTPSQQSQGSWKTEKTWAVVRESKRKRFWPVDSKSRRKKTSPSTAEGGAAANVPFRKQDGYLQKMGQWEEKRTGGS